MRLARKLTLALVLGIVAVMGTYAWVQIGREVVLDKADLDRARRMGRAIRVMLEHAWEQGGAERVEGHLRAICAKTGWRARLVPNDEFFGEIKAGWTEAQRREFRANNLLRVKRAGVAPPGWLGGLCCGTYAHTEPPAGMVTAASPMRHGQRSSARPIGSGHCPFTPVRHALRSSSVSGSCEYAARYTYFQDTVSASSRRTDPARTGSSPATALSSVDLPTPLRPIRQVRLPSGTSRVTPNSTSVGP